MEKATIVHNPAARNSPTRARLAAAAATLRDDGWEIGVISTDGPAQAMALAREAAAAGASVVFAAGGDGTINEVANGLAGGDCALGVVRGGMGDVFAKEVGISRRPEEALRLLVTGERRRFDLGLAGERYFLLMCGIGFDASVVKRERPRLKQRLGSASYVVMGMREVVRFKPEHTRLKLDGVEHEAELYWALLSNTRSYGGVVDIARDAKVDDGLLDAYVFEGRGVLRVASTAARVIAGRHTGTRGVTSQRLQEFEVLTPGIGVQADGEYFGETPLKVGIAPAALDVLLPRGGKASRLFADAG